MKRAAKEVSRGAEIGFFGISNRTWLSDLRHNSLAGNRIAPKNERLTKFAELADMPAETFAGMPTIAP